MDKWKGRKEEKCERMEGRKGKKGRKEEKGEWMDEWMDGQRNHLETASPT